MDPQTILDVSGAVPEAAVDALMKACRSNSFAEVQQAITDGIADGFPVSASAELSRAKSSYMSTGVSSRSKLG